MTFITFDLKKNREVRITDGLRARDPFPSPDGRKLIFVTNRLGKTRLGLLKLPSATASPVWRGRGHHLAY